MESRLSGFLRAGVYADKGSLYVIVVNDRNQDAGRVRISLSGLTPSQCDVMFEQRSATIDSDGTWNDEFGPYDVHIYRVDLP